MMLLASGYTAQGLITAGNRIRDRRGRNGSERRLVDLVTMAVRTNAGRQRSCVRRRFGGIEGAG